MTEEIASMSGSGASDLKASARNRSRNSAKLDAEDNVPAEAATPPQPPQPPNKAELLALSICVCASPADCITLKNVLESFKAPLSEEHAWAVIYQTVKMYRSAAASCAGHVFGALEIPDSVGNLSMHRDGTVHCSWSGEELEQRCQPREHPTGDHDLGEYNQALIIENHKKVLRQVGLIVFTAIDYNLRADEQSQVTRELEALITYMTPDEETNEDCIDDCIDEGIDEGYKRWDDENDDDKCTHTKELDYVLEACENHVKPTVAEEHYKAVCRALVTEAIELRIFLQHVLSDDAEKLRLKVKTHSSKQELDKLNFHDWARFWMQVIDELRRGVRLKKCNFSRAPIEYELTPYEILMADIRSKKYQLRKVMVNGDIPPRVKKDAHALILEFIRSRPPLKKASERQLPPPVQRTPSPREQLMDSIRQGRTLKHIPLPAQPRLKDRLLPQTTAAAAGTRHAFESQKLQHNYDAHSATRSKQRLIKVDFSLLQDDDPLFDDSFASTSNRSNASSCSHSSVGFCSQPKMPPYPIGGYMVNPAAPTAPDQPPTTSLTTRVLRRTTYDLATQCESRRASLRRHTIVGCQSNFDETQSTPPSRPASRQSAVNTSSEAEGVRATSTKTAKPQHNNNNISFGASSTTKQKPQLQLKRCQSPGGSSHDSVDVHGGGGGGGGGGSNCSRSSSSIGPWNKSFLDERTWHERGDDRLSLTLEEIVHIRSVMTKAELEGLPVGVRVKEDVEKRKVCFLCLRTRFSIFGPWGVQCKLCQRTVCSKCYTKMRLPVENFRHVPLVLISPSLLASPAVSNTPSPSPAHHGHASSTASLLDDTFPKSLIERLLRSESQRKTRNTVGSAPSSPKHQRSNMSTPGIVAPSVAGQAVDDAASTHAAAAASAAVSNNNKENAQLNGATAAAAAATAAAAANKHISIMSRSVEGPRSLPVHSPARPHSNSSTLDRKSKFSRAFTLSPAHGAAGSQLGLDGLKENVRGEIVPVCHDCKGLVMEITRSSKQTRSSARNRALQNLTLDLSPVYK